jgi:hypothetical protein
MAQLIRIVAGFGVALWGCWVLDLTFGAMTLSQSFGMFLLLIAGSMMRWERPK